MPMVYNTDKIRVRSLLIGHCSSDDAYNYPKVGFERGFTAEVLAFRVA